ncbi:hypothetical protein MRA01_62630 [Methylobacterium radiotolerans]|nr:hypothetical protein MRA01_62630 [Methylobacterium radiotolerans]
MQPKLKSTVAALRPAAAAFEVLSPSILAESIQRRADNIPVTNPLKVHANGDPGIFENPNFHNSAANDPRTQTIATKSATGTIFFNIRFSDPLEASSLRSGYELSNRLSGPVAVGLEAGASVSRGPTGGLGGGQHRSAVLRHPEQLRPGGESPRTI